MLTKCLWTTAVALASLAAVSSASAQTLTTAAPNNGSGGVFMDLAPVGGSLNLTGFATYFSSTAGTAVNVEVWTRPGSYVGFSTSNADWTLSQTVTGTSAGTATLSGMVTLTSPILLSSGGTTAVYLHATTSGGGIRYTGTGTTAVTSYSNADITLNSTIARTGTAAFGGAQNTPRCFAGTIQYVSANPNAMGACCTATATCTVDSPVNCSAAGNVFLGDGTNCSPNNCSHRGACCSSTSTACTLSSNGAAGCASGSTYQGDATSCSPNNCPPPPPPANDECANAVALTLGATATGSNVNATQSASLVNDGTNPWCTQTTWATGAPNNQKDVFWKYTPAQSGNFTVDTCGSAIDTILSIHSACPIDQSSLVSCNDDSTSGTGNIACSTGTNSRIPSVSLAAGTTYYIRVFGYNNATGALAVTINTVTSGACCNNTTAACTTSITGAAGCAAGTTYQGDNTACTPTPCPQEACCNNTSGACTTAAVGACASGTTGQGAGTTCSPTPCQAEACCNPTTGACTTAAVGACASGTTGQGVGTTCTVNPCPQPPPPANDLCSNAQALSLNVAVQGSNAFATGDGTEGPGGSCFTTSPTSFNKGVWYTFTAPATTNYLVSTCGSTFDTVLAVFASTGSPACDNLTQIGCDDDTCIGATDNPLPGPGTSALASVIASTPMTAGQTCYIRIASWSGSTTSGAYGIVVQYAAGVTVGSCCVASACTLTDATNCTGTFTSGGSCSPNPCGPAGVCCRGATCTTSVTSAAACSGSLIGGQTAGAAFPAAAACNGAPISSSPCCYADYNKTGGVQVNDIFDFLNDWFAGSPYANTGGTGAPGPLSVQNIFDFLSNWFAGGC